jgi:hypothetical protein
VAAAKLTGTPSTRYPLVACAVRIAPKSVTPIKAAIRKLQENLSLLAVAIVATEGFGIKCRIVVVEFLELT